MIVAGIDIGSISTETVIMQDQQILGFSILATGANHLQAAELSLTKALTQAGLTRTDLAAIVTTGYGRNSFLMPPKRSQKLPAMPAELFYLNPGYPHGDRYWRPR